MTAPALEPLDTLPEWTGEHPTLGWQIAEWALGKRTASTPAAEPRFRVPAGPFAGRPWALTDRQLVFLLWWYALDDHGGFVVRGGSMRHARGTGKSPLAGFLGCAELVGPCRFSHWGPDGEPVGKRASMPLVQVAAVSEAQTEWIMQYVRAWLGKGSPLAVEYGLDPGKQVVYAPGSGATAAGKLQVITSSAATVRGATPSLVLCDEVGEWTETNGGARFRATLGDNAAKVADARILECANTWRPGLGSVAEQRWDAWELEQGDDPVPGHRPWLMDVREAPADTDWSEPDAIRAALTGVYRDVPWINVEQLMPTILDPGKPIRESMREYGNLRVSDLTTWVDRQAWDACGDPTAELADGDEVVLFCDPSESDDATALVACRVSDGLVVPLWIHEPHALDPDGRPFGDVDPGEIDRHVRLAFDRFSVLAFRSDVRPIEQLARSEWHERYGDDLVVWSSKTDAVAYDMRRTQLEFARACELTASEVARGELCHDGDRVLARHVVNTQRRPYREFVSVAKGDRSRKIDGAVAMIGARDLRRTLLESEEYRRHVRRRRRSGSRVTVLR